MASAFTEKEQRIQAAQPKILKVHNGHTKKITAMAWSPSGHLLATGSADTTIVLWAIDTLTGTVKKAENLRGHGHNVDALAWSPADGNILASSGYDKTVRFWDTRSSRQTSSVTIPGAALSIAWRLDGSLLAAGTRDDQLLVIDARRGTVVRNHAFANTELNDFAFTPSGLLYCALGVRGATNDEGHIGVYNLSEDGTRLAEVARVKGHTMSTVLLRFDPSFRYFATGANDSLVCVWDAADVACIRSIDRVEGLVRSVAFANDGQHVAIAAGDREDATKALDIVRTSDGSRVRSLPTKEGVAFCAWAPHAQILAYCLDEPRTLMAGPSPACDVRLLVAPS